MLNGYVFLHAQTYECVSGTYLELFFGKVGGYETMNYAHNTYNIGILYLSLHIVKEGRGLNL